MSPNLHACPFCGSQDAAVHDISSDDHRSFFSVTCGNCEADGPVERTEEDAIEAWNTRAEPSKADGNGG